MAKRKPAPRSRPAMFTMVAGIRIQGMRELDPTFERHTFSGGYNTSALARNNKLASEAKSYMVKGAPTLFGGRYPDTFCVPRFQYASVVAKLESQCLSTPWG